MFTLETSNIVTEDAFNFSDISDGYIKESKNEKSFKALCFPTMPKRCRGEENSGPGSN